MCIVYCSPLLAVLLVYGKAAHWPPVSCPEDTVDFLVKANSAFVIGLLFFIRWLFLVIQVLNEALEIPARVVQ